MDVEFSVADRLILLDTLPRENNLTTMRIVADIINLIGFSAEERKLLEFKQTAEGLEWNPSVGIQSKKIELSPAFISFLIERLLTLDGSSKMRVEHVFLHDKLSSL